MRLTYYNEIDKYCVQWLTRLMYRNLIPFGDIDDRPIQEVRASDLTPYRAHHFFAGIGGWAYALRLAGWDDNAAVWTGSCPCQPFSVAGKRKGIADERHLWPEFLRLIKKCRPAIAFGEQVASADGREWFTGVRVDLEALGYAVGGADLCAAGVGAPHIRQRLWWVADAGYNAGTARNSRSEQQPQSSIGEQSGSESAVSRLAESKCGGLEKSKVSIRQSRQNQTETFQRRTVNGLVHPPRQQTGQPRFPWEHFDVVDCLDGKTRRIGPGIFPLAHGVPARVGAIKAAGNAIVPQVAAEFISAYMERAA